MIAVLCGQEGLGSATEVEAWPLEKALQYNVRLQHKYEVRRKAMTR